MLGLLKRLVDTACALLLGVIAALAFFQVVARYILGFSTPWSEELLRLLFVWLALLGAARTVHMRVDMLEQAAGPLIRRGLVLLQALVAVGLLVLLIWHGLTLIELTAYDRYTALPVSVQWLYWAIVVAGGLWLLFLITETAAKLRGDA
ncbi:MAG: hypothetical protein DIU63_15205 [Proteobacteria bacterium]|jgi:TRAP-type C4-dicarboxylate transport system, small permease component|nr:MAG: hypothetical protein DIU63_15205 [Pseudomonadota bacterium]